MRAGQAAIIAALLIGPSALAADPRPVVTIRADRPDRQLREVIALFQGARAPHPAAALAAWKRAGRGSNTLGKPLEALIAAINPRMIGELRTLDDAELALWIRPEDGRASWGLQIPRDDGTFAALASALVLTGGSAEAPLDDLPVDRLGGPSSPLMARAPRALLIGADREGLEVARGRSKRPRRGLIGGDGLEILVEPDALRGSRSLPLRRLEEALGPRSLLFAQANLFDSKLDAKLALSVSAPIAPATIEREWLDWVPAGRASAAFAVAVPRDPGAWDAWFGLADRVERVDPARANMAPLRLRVALMARAAGVRAEADVWPHLRGVSGWIGSDGKAFDRGLVAFHLDDDGVARRIVAKAGPGAGDDPAPPEGRIIGRIVARPVRIARAGAAVVLAWGDGTLEASIEARGRPDHSAGPALRDRWFMREPIGAGGIWPGRVPGLVPEGSALARALVDSPPILWSADREGPDACTIAAWWNGLDSTVRRLLDLIPLDPPPDHDRGGNR